MLRKIIIYILLATFVVPFDILPTKVKAAENKCNNAAYCFTAQHALPGNPTTINLYINNHGAYEKLGFNYIKGSNSATANTLYYQLVAGKSYLNLGTDETGLLIDNSGSTNLADNKQIQLAGFSLEGKDGMQKGFIFQQKEDPAFKYSAGSDGGAAANTMNSFYNKLKASKLVPMNVTEESSTGAPTLPTPGENVEWDTANAKWAWSFNDSTERYIVQNDIMYRDQSTKELYRYQFTFDQKASTTTFAYINNDGTKRSTGGDYLMKISSISRFKNGQSTGEQISTSGINNLAVIVSRKNTTKTPNLDINNPYPSFSDKLYAFPFWRISDHVSELNKSQISTCFNKGGYVMSTDIIGVTNAMNWLPFFSDPSSVQKAGGECVIPTSSAPLSGLSGGLGNYLNKTGAYYEINEPILPKAAVDKCSAMVPKINSLNIYLDDFETFVVEVLEKGGMTTADAKKRVTDTFQKEKIGTSQQLETWNSFILSEYAGNWIWRKPPNSNYYPNEHITATKVANMQSLVAMAEGLTYTTSDADIQIGSLKFNMLKVINGEYLAEGASWIGTNLVEMAKANPKGGAIALLSTLLLSGLIIKGAWAATKGIGRLVVSGAQTAVMSWGAAAAIGIGALAIAAIAIIYGVLSSIKSSQIQYFNVAMAAGYSSYLAAKQIAFQGCIMHDTGSSKPDAKILARNGYTDANLRAEENHLKLLYKTAANALVNSSTILDPSGGIQARDENNCPASPMPHIFEWAFCNLYALIMKNILLPITKLLFEWLRWTVGIDVTAIINHNFIIPKQDYYLPKTP